MSFQFITSGAPAPASHLLHHHLRAPHPLLSGYQYTRVGARHATKNSTLFKPLSGFSFRFSEWMIFLLFFNNFVHQYQNILNDLIVRFLRKVSFASSSKSYWVFRFIRPLQGDRVDGSPTGGCLCPGPHCAWSNHAVRLLSMVVPSTLEACEHFSFS